MDNTPEQIFLTVADAAGMIAVSRMTLLRLIRNGEMSTVRIGRAVRIPRSVLDAFVERKVAEAASQRAACGSH